MNAAAGGAAVAFASTPAPDDTGSTAKYSTLRNGMMNSSEVRNLQTRLRELGFFNAEVDGSFGTKTETAVKRFQSAAGCRSTASPRPRCRSCCSPTRRRAARPTPRRPSPPPPQRPRNRARGRPDTLSGRSR
ncbi:MAG: peptidoglycan-binding protein [Clostridiales bacterium]|nr:peptidoglycan-binding protein [Clostridiales bacterium]